MQVISPKKFPGPDLRDRVVIRQVHGGVDWDPSLAGLLRPRVLLPVGQPAADLREPALVSVFLLDVRDRRPDEHIHGAVEDVERRGPELPFAADDLPGLNSRFTTAFLFSSRKVPETPLKTGSWRIHSASSASPPPSSVAITRLLVSAPVGHDTMHSPHDTSSCPLAVQIEGNACRVAAPGAPDDVVLLDLVTSAHAAVAEDAGFMIDGDAERGVVVLVA